MVQKSCIWRGFTLLCAGGWEKFGVWVQDEKEEEEEAGGGGKAGERAHAFLHERM